MPADLMSSIVLILVTASETVLWLWPYVAAGILSAVLISRILKSRTWALPATLCGPVPRRLSVPAAAVAGAVSPVPTAGMVPLLLPQNEGSRPARTALTFALASLLINPQIFILTLGALGLRFALAQLAAVLVLSVGLGLLFGAGRTRLGRSARGRATSQPGPGPMSVLDVTAHVILYFLIGVILGAAFQVILPQLGVLDWLGKQGLLSSPLLGWLAAPFYTCGGSAVPMASGLAQTGFSTGALFAFLLAGPVLRGSALASLGALLPRRLLILCVVVLVLVSGLIGVGIDWLTTIA